MRVLSLMKTEFQTHCILLQAFGVLVTVTHSSLVGSWITFPLFIYSFCIFTINIYYGKNKNYYRKTTGFSKTQNYPSPPGMLTKYALLTLLWMTAGYKTADTKHRLLNIYTRQRPVGRAHTRRGHRAVLCLHRTRLMEIVQEVGEAGGRNPLSRRGVAFEDADETVYCDVQRLLWIWRSPLRVESPALCPGPYLPVSSLSICQDLESSQVGNCFWQATNMGPREHHGQYYTMGGRLHSLVTARWPARIYSQRLLRTMVENIHLLKTKQKNFFRTSVQVKSSFLIKNILHVVPGT